MSESPFAEQFEKDVRPPSEALRKVFQELNYKDRESRKEIFSDELHYNGLGLRYVFIPFNDTSERVFRESTTAEKTTRLREALAHPEAHPHDDVRENSFARMVDLLNTLNMGRLLSIELPVDHVAHTLTKEQFGKLMRDVADKQIAALGKVGTSDVRIDEATYRGYVDNLVTAYAEGVDANQYVTVMADTLSKKGPASEPEANKSMREALARTLHNVSQAITRTQEHAKTH